MKKKTVCQILACLLGAALLSGCGATEETTQSSASSASESSASDATDTESESTSEEEETALVMDESFEVDPIMEIPTISGEYEIEDCITLGDYKGLDLTMQVEEVTDEDVDTYIGYLLIPEEVEDENATVQKGDTVNLDFAGKKDGEPFDGGTGEDYDLEIGSGNFIDGFEDGMIGMKKGETRDLNLTFPENYNEELSGADVVFTVTVNAIKRTPELTDAWVNDLPDNDYKTVEELRTGTREELEASNREYAESETQEEAWQMVLDNASVKAFPEDLLQNSADSFTEYVTEEADMYGMELEDYLAELGMSTAYFENLRDTQARMEVRDLLLTRALAKAENITEEDEAYIQEVEKLEEMYGMTREELKESYGEEVLENYILQNVIMKRVLDQANLTVETIGTEGTVAEDDTAIETE